RKQQIALRHVQAPLIGLPESPPRLVAHGLGTQVVHALLEQHLEFRCIPSVDSASHHVGSLIHRSPPRLCEIRLLDPTALNFEIPVNFPSSFPTPRPPIAAVNALQPMTVMASPVSAASPWPSPPRTVPDCRQHWPANKAADRDR